MEKVKLPKEVAEAIEYLRSKGETTADIVSNCFGNANAKPYLTIKGFWDTHKDFERLLKALVNGYEVEQTQEDKIFELYEKAREAEAIAKAREDGENIQFYRGKMAAIPQVLDCLNIKIEGVNA